MTFEQFQATRQMSGDLGAALRDDRWEDQPPAIGYLYLDALYIEKVQSHWPKSAQAEGEWYLVLGRDEWITNDLEGLERKLYAFAVAEGYSNDGE